jgi:hypothetical protein
MSERGTVLRSLNSLRKPKGDIGLAGKKIRRHPLANAFLFGYGLCFLLCILAGMLCLFYSTNWPRAEDLQFIDHLRTAEQGLRSWASLLVTSWNVDHPVGLQMVLVTALWQATGINFIAISIANYAILTATALLLLWATKDETKRAFLVPAILLPLAAFHPSQMNHLIWPYEMGWFLITFILVLNAVAIERFRWPVLWATLGCALASYASAHGRLLWLIAAAHVLAATRNRSRLLIATAFFTVFILFATTSPRHTDTPDLLTLIMYILRLPGSLFGIRSEPWLLLCSALLIAPLACLLAKSRNTPATRISAALILASALFIAAFSVGRAIHGLPWALGRFHATPLFVPAMFGAIILAGTAIGSGGLRRWIGAALCLIFTTSATTALPYARQRGLENLAFSKTGRRLVCAGERSFALTFFFETGPDIDIIRRNADAIQPLCH